MLLYYVSGDSFPVIHMHEGRSADDGQSEAPRPATAGVLNLVVGVMFGCGVDHPFSLLRSNSNAIDHYVKCTC